MFKNLAIYKMGDELNIEVEDLREKMSACLFTPCSGDAVSSAGWIPAISGFEDVCYSSNGQILLTIKTEEKILPSAVIKEFLDEKVARIEEMEGKKLKKADKDRLKDEVIYELLPRAFSKYNKTLIWINNAKKFIIVETGSFNKAEDALALLRKTLGSLPVTPMETTNPIENTLTAWIRDGEVAEGFTVLDEAELKATLEEGGVLTSKKEDLFSEEIKQHIEAGKQVTKLAVDWQEKVSFLISNDGMIKKIKMSDSVLERNSEISKEDFALKFDADFVLETGELTELIEEIYKTF